MSDLSPVSSWFDGLGQPCDPEIFQRALEVWQTGGQFKLRNKPPTQSGLYLSDIPINRSAMATLGFLRARGVTGVQAYLWRIMHFNELLDHMRPDGLLAKYVKPEDEKGVMSVSEALLHAVAIAPIKMPIDLSAKDYCLFDVEEIARLAEENWKADSEATGSK